MTALVLSSCAAGCDASNTSPLPAVEETKKGECNFLPKGKEKSMFCKYRIYSNKRPGRLFFDPSEGWAFIRGWATIGGWAFIRVNPVFSRSQRYMKGDLSI